MEYALSCPSPAFVASVKEAILQEDPSACIDVEPSSGAMRVATVLDVRSLAAVIRGSGITIDDADIAQRPSICCGGCSG